MITPPRSAASAMITSDGAARLGSARAFRRLGPRGHAGCRGLRCGRLARRPPERGYDVHDNSGRRHDVSGTDRHTAAGRARAVVTKPDAPSLPAAALRLSGAAVRVDVQLEPPRLSGGGHLHPERLRLR